MSDSLRAASFKNNRAVAVQKNPFFEQELDRLGKHYLFYIPPRMHHRPGGVSARRPERVGNKETSDFRSS